MRAGHAKIQIISTIDRILKSINFTLFHVLRIPFAIQSMMTNGSTLTFFSQKLPFHDKVVGEKKNQ
jgi:hypothetical protein